VAESCRHTQRKPFLTNSYSAHSSNKQHEVFKIAFGGLYPAADTVEAVLAEDAGHNTGPKRILDVGKYSFPIIELILILILVIAL
jgi:hypothetical protein